MRTFEFVVLGCESSLDYYILDQSKGMAQTAAALAPSLADIGTTPWLTEAELDVYVNEWGGPDFKVP